jgi:O-antigen/teichoic acid export membrane protein
VLSVVATFLVDSTHPSLLAIAVCAGIPAIPFLALAQVEAGALQGLGFLLRGQIPTYLLRPVFLSLVLLVIDLSERHLGPIEAMALNSATAGTAFLLAYVWLRQRLPQKPAVMLPIPRRQWIVSSVPVALAEGMRILQSEFSTIIIGLIGAPTSVGLFRIALATANMASAIVPAVIQIAFPIIAKLHAEDDHARLQKALTMFSFVQLIVVATLSAPLLVVPDALLLFVFGNEFVFAGGALRILAVGHIITASFGPSLVLLIMTHHERRVTRAMAIGLAVNLVATPIFVVLWGIAGAGGALAVSTLAWNIIGWRDSRRLVGIETSALVLMVRWGAARYSSPVKPYP